MPTQPAAGSEAHQWRIDLDALTMTEQAPIIPKTAVIIGPNTLSGTPQDFTRQNKAGGWGEFCTPWEDSSGAPFDSNASRVAIWFRTWDEAQAFVAMVRAHGEEPKR